MVIQVVTINFLVVLLLGELACKIFPHLVSQQPPYDTAEPDNLLGWKPKGNYVYEGQMQGDDGASYPVHFTTQTNGFRRYPLTINESSKRLLLIGDSFTQAVEVSDDKTFYAVLEQELELPVFAYGMAGYGTLQEYLVLDKYLDTIDPEIVLLQFCSNDFIDNELELERQANYFVGQRRPYLQSDGSMLYASPLSRWDCLTDHSCLLRKVKQIWRKLQARHADKADESAESQIAQHGLQYKWYQSAVDKTLRLLRRIKERVGPERKLAILLADPFQPHREQLKGICQKLNIPLIDFPKVQFDQLKKEKSLHSHDGYHWNEAGHQLVAEAVLQFLQE